MNESLRETTVEHRSARQPLRGGFDPLRLFAEHGFAARLWCAVALLAIAYAVICPYLLLRAKAGRERVVILDPAGTFHVSPLLAFEEAGKLHEQHALLACLALFQRHPGGADHPELLNRLFLETARRRAEALLTADAEEFQAKQMHQKAEVQKVTVLETRENVVLVHAEGQLIRTGVFQGVTFTEAPTFRVRFAFARNPDMAANHRFPLAVWSFELSS